MCFTYKSENNISESEIITRSYLLMRTSYVDKYKLDSHKVHMY